MQRTCPECGKKMVVDRWRPMFQATGNNGEGNFVDLLERTHRCPEGHGFQLEAASPEILKQANFEL